MRKLASIRKIDDVRPIEGADAIECAVVGGWTVVVKKGEYKPGDLAVYCEIDSWIPVEVAPFLVKGKEPREFEGVKGERLKTIKLRGQLSQGLLLPLSVLNVKQDGVVYETLADEGCDVTDVLNIKKWEKAIPAQLAGQVRGNFPTLIPKTDQERCQNIVCEIAAAMKAGLRFEVTEKLEGSSCTMYMDPDGEFHVCSRNMDLKRDENNSFWRAAIANDVERKMRDMELFGVAVQGELIGPGIQGNIYKLNDVRFFVFDVYSVKNGGYLDPAERRDLIAAMGIDHAPVLAASADLTDTLGITTVEQMLAFADGKSVLGDINGPLREGVVFKQVDGGMSFKAISNQYLLGEK